jgi:tetratricopeptide (TPR) repeat protein
LLQQLDLCKKFEGNPLSCGSRRFNAPATRVSLGEFRMQFGNKAAARIRPRKGCALRKTCVCLFLVLCLIQPLPWGLAQSVPASQPQTSGTVDSLTRAKQLLEQDNKEEAERQIRIYLEDHPNSADAHFLLGHILFKQAKANESLAEYTNGARHHEPSPVDLKVVALDYVLLGDYADADKWLTRSLQKAPQDAEAWYYLGRTKYNENRFEEAVTAFHECLKRQPRNIKAQDNLGLSYQALGREDEAIAAYRTAIAWQADVGVTNASPLINLASLLLELNRPQDAIHYLQQAEAISPEVYSKEGLQELQPRLHEQLGKGYSLLNQLPQAQAQMERAVQLSPQNPRLHYLLGQIYRKQRLSEKAKAEFERYIELSRDRVSSAKPQP